MSGAEACGNRALELAMLAVRDSTFAAILSLGLELGGTIAGEHGVGLLNPGKGV